MDFERNKDIKSSMNIGVHPAEITGGRFHSLGKNSQTLTLDNILLFIQCATQNKNIKSHINEPHPLNIFLRMRVDKNHPLWLGDEFREIRLSAMSGRWIKIREDFFKLDHFPIY